MVVFKYTIVASFLLLSACAPKPQVNEASPAFAPLPHADSPNIPVEKQINADSKNLDKKPLTSEFKETVETTTSAKKEKLGNSSASKITSWDLSGALAARSKGKGWSASLNWIQRGAGSYQFRLSGPVGSGTILVTKSDGVVTLRDGKKTVSSSNAVSLLQQQTGISLPVPNLYYWVRGIPAPGSVQSKQQDESGRLRLLRQAGYTIEYQQYTSVGKAVLPTSIRLQGNGIFLKLIIKHWRV